MWNNERPWYNERIIETIISSEEIDFHGEVVNKDAIYRVLPFLAQHGIYNYWHSNFPIGEIIGWRVDEKGLPMIKVGIHDTKHSNIPQHDDVWKEIKQYNTRGQSSIEGVSNLTQSCDGKPSKIQDMGLWAVAWVGDGAANPNANVTFVNEMAKVAKSIGMMPDNKGNLVKIQHNEIIKEYINKEIRKQLGGKEMKTIVKEEPPKEDEEKPEEDMVEEKAEDTEETPVAEVPEEVPAVEEAPAEEPVVAEPEMKEEVPDGLAQQVASLTEQVKLMASALEMIRAGTPDALADAADAAEIVSEVIEQAEVIQAVTGEDTVEAPAEESELITMRKEMEQLKKENAEFKAKFGNVVEKETPKPTRRGVVKNQNVEIPGFDTKEMIKAANSGNQTEFFRTKFGYNRKIAR